MIHLPIITGRVVWQRVQNRLTLLQADSTIERSLTDLYELLLAPHNQSTPA